MLRWELRRDAKVFEVRGLLGLGGIEFGSGQQARGG
jgi:hypothetical protein